MGKMLYSVTMSLDGFIAGPAGDVSWLTEHLGPNPEVDEVIGKIGALHRPASPGSAWTRARSTRSSCSSRP